MLYLAPLNVAMATYAINTPFRVAAFLAQLATESYELRWTHEKWTKRKNFHLPSVKRPAHTATSEREYFNYWYGNRRKLGNLSVDDGYNYRGRGAIQVTGRNNYTSLGKALGKPLDSNPSLLEEDPQTDISAAAFLFARMEHLNTVADMLNPEDPSSIKDINRRVTFSINGGWNGLDKRLAYYCKALEVLGVKTAA